LRKLGKVLHLSKSRALIVDLDPPKWVRPGTKACDSKLKNIGIVIDILGPVSAPYASVKPTIAKPESVVGRTVYALED
jgi:RNA-binding protein